MRKTGQRKNRFFGQTGSEMVEFAITFPLFCVMVLGSVEVGWLLYQQSILDYAARQGARYASVDTATATALKPGVNVISAQAQTVITSAVTQFGGAAPSSFALSWPGSRTFALVVREPYAPVAKGLVPIISGINEIKTTVTMYCEACG